jgi:hypothetical protein
MEIRENFTSNIDISGFPKGVYFVKISSTVYSEISEFIVE